MSYFVVYVLDERGRVEDGDTVASGRGWDDWSERVCGLPISSVAAQLGWAGYVEGPQLDDLAKELAALAKKAPPPLDDVTRQLLAQVHGRPEGTLALLVSDGTMGPSDSDSDSDEEE